MSFVVELASSPDRDELVAEIWWSDQMVAEVRRASDGSRYIDQHPPGLVGGADAHALHDGAGLGFPVEMDRQHADRLAIGLAAGANARAIGRDLSIAEQWLALDIAGDIVVARAQVARFAKPF